MKKKELQEALELTQTLLGQWIRYRQYYLKGISDDEIAPHEDTEFLATTSNIAQTVRKLTERLDEKQYPFKSKEISALIKSTISINYFRTIPENDKKTFYSQWHVIRVYLSRTVGALKFIEEGYIPPVGGRKGAATKTKKKGGGGKIVMIIVAIILVLGGAVGALVFLGFI